MNNQQILEKAINLAIAGGWEMEFANTTLWRPKELAEFSLMKNYPTLGSLIFNHNFAKALWGEEAAYSWSGDVVPAEPDETAEPMWQYHLQQMVIAEDPIKYLGEHL